MSSRHLPLGWEGLLAPAARATQLVTAVPTGPRGLGFIKPHTTFPDAAVTMRMYAVYDHVVVKGVHENNLVACGG
jgi:hypothetical protein